MISTLHLNGQVIAKDDDAIVHGQGMRIITDSNYSIINFLQRNCKGGYAVMFENGERLPASRINDRASLPGATAPGFLQVKGYISYEYYYNERIDTPYNVNSYQQHTLSGQLQVILKNKYPLNLSFSTRQTNNPFFRNLLDVGVLFDRNQFNRLSKERYLKKLALGNPMQQLLKEKLAALKDYEAAYRALSAKLDERAIIQAIVHEREQVLQQKMKQGKPSFYVKDSIEKIISFKGKDYNVKVPGDTFWTKQVSVLPELPRDSILKTPTEKWYEAQLQKLAALKASKRQLEQYTDSLKKEIATEQQSAEASFGDARKWKLHKEKYGKKATGKEERFSSILQDIKSIGIGRTNIDYSELTVKNLNLTGLQVEYQPNLYYALAGGKIDYSFRDFFLSDLPVPKQEFYIARFGVVRENKSSLIISSFAGKKNSYVLNNQVSNSFNGYSIYGKMYLNEESYVDGELAKTTPVKSILNQDKPATLFGFSNNSNLGLVARVHIKLLKPRTVLDGYYRKTGYAFQSMSLFSNTMNQDAWQVRAEQPLFRNMLKLTAMLKKNDFVYPSAAQNFNTNAIFKTFKIGFRKKALFFDIGYYPGSQLVKQDSGKVLENMYYMFNTTGGYTKRIGKFYSSTVVNYNVFINQSTDTGFVYFKGKSIQLNQSFVADVFAVHGGFTVTNQPSLNYYTLESSAEISKLKWLSFGAGIKYNKVKTGSDYWGGSGNITITMGRWATIKAYYDQLYIPSTNKSLSKSDIGRVQLIKYF